MEVNWTFPPATEDHADLGLAIQLVKNLVDKGEPVEIKEKVKELVQQGHGRDEAIEKIALLLVKDMDLVLNRFESFDIEKLKNKLKDLH